MISHDLSILAPQNWDFISWADQGMSHGCPMVRPPDLQRLPERLREKQRLASSRLLGRQLASGHALGRLDGMEGIHGTWNFVESSVH